ncbi:MAG: hypothetical protein P8175_16825 [Deltaproteobacteria bacterium]|jgi:hypothetical protein
MLRPFEFLFEDRRTRLKTQNAACHFFDMGVDKRASCCLKAFAIQKQAHEISTLFLRLSQACFLLYYRLLTDEQIFMSMISATWLGKNKIRDQPNALKGIGAPLYAHEKKRSGIEVKNESII